MVTSTKKLFSSRLIDSSLSGGSETGWGFGGLAFWFRLVRCCTFAVDFAQGVCLLTRTRRSHWSQGLGTATSLFLFQIWSLFLCIFFSPSFTRYMLFYISQTWGTNSAADHTTTMSADYSADHTTTMSFLLCVFKPVAFLPKRSWDKSLQKNNLLFIGALRRALKKEINGYENASKISLYVSHVLNIFFSWLKCWGQKILDAN